MSYNETFPREEYSFFYKSFVFSLQHCVLIIHFIASGDPRFKKLNVVFNYQLSSMRTGCFYSFSLSFFQLVVVAMSLCEFVSSFILSLCFLSFSVYFVFNCLSLVIKLQKF